MNLFFNHAAQAFVGLAAAASLGLGGSVAAHNIQAHSDTKADVEVGNQGDSPRSDKNEVKHSAAKPAMIDIAIGAKGRVLVHGATVTAVSTGSVSAKSTVGASSINWTLNTASAKFIAKENSTTTLASIVVGDTVSFTGTLSSTTAFAVDVWTLHDTTR